MKQYLNCIIQDKGEGIMLRKPKSLYIQGKSYSLFKAKVHNVVDILLRSVE